MPITYCIPMWSRESIHNSPVICLTVSFSTHSQIEPESQTQLLDATMNMDGVLLTGVPGAGGFDAVFAITLGNSSSNVMKAWSSLNVLALLVREDPRGVSLEISDPQAKEITSAMSSVHIR